MNQNCPACGAPVQFRSAAPYAVCSHCQSLLVRRDIRLEAIGRVAAVPEDFSPLQLHASGWFEQHHFTLLGRIRKVWEQGSWNEWCASFDDRRLGWLAEAQGDLVMTFEQPAGALAQFPAGTAPAPGDSYMLDRQRFEVSDVKDVQCLGAEGELLSAPTPGQAMKSVDLRGPGLAFATIELSAPTARLFVGRFVEFAECRFAGLRALDGWAQDGNPR